MPDLAGSLISFRTGSGPAKVKVIRGTYEAETGHNRAVTSEASGHPRSVMTSLGGILRFEGYFTKDSNIVALSPSVIGTPATLYNVRVCTDVVGEAATQSPYFIHFNDGPASEPGGMALNFRWTAEVSVDGMQTFEVEIHSQYGSVINTTA